ncbi:acid protease [Pseudohyphozyma bogoriensis]|nr:acid protease [Pseudohyphozyma bogoriensis]
MLSTVAVPLSVLALVAGTANAASAVFTGLTTGSVVSFTNEDGTANTTALLAEHDRVRAKYAARGPTSRKKRSTRERRASSNQPALNPDDSEYGGTLKFGSNGQPMTVHLDTGSSDLWVPVKSFNDLGGGTYFHTDQSTSYVASTRGFFVEYADKSSMTGTIGTDTVTWGPFTVPSLEFGAITSTASTGPFNGLIGLGVNPSGGKNDEPIGPNFLQKLIQANALTSKLFALYLPKMASGKSAEISIGALDPTKFTGSMISYATTGNDWQVMTTARVNGRAVRATSFNANIDSGTSACFVPKAALKGVFAGIPGAKLNSATTADVDTWQYPCSTKVRFSFTFAGSTSGGAKEWTFDASEMSSGTVDGDSTQCVATCMGSNDIALDQDKKPLALLGDSFERPYYIAYTFQDYQTTKSISFAQAV